MCFIRKEQVYTMIGTIRLIIRPTSFTAKIKSPTDWKKFVPRTSSAVTTPATPCIARAAEKSMDL